jgi:sugar phosphate isomerase/epimerase
MFHRFTAFEAIEKTAAAGGKVIEFYPGQSFSPDDRKTKLTHNLPEEALQKLQEKLRQHNLIAVNYGVVDIPRDEADARRLFQFGKKLGVRAITTEPAADQMDLIEKLVKEFDMPVAIHNHPPHKNDPSYRLWDAKYAFSLVKGRDIRIGTCGDIGHWSRSGVDLIEALKLFEGRVISIHLKDVVAANPDSTDVPLGLGISKTREVLQELRRQKFDGNISIEYERDWENTVPDIAQCIGYVRGFTDAVGKGEPKP